LNNDAASLWPGLFSARQRVLDHQLKLHRWARADPARRFGDVFNLVCDRATLVVAWERVSGNRGARTAGVDAVTRYHVEERLGVIPFLEELRSSLRDGSFTPLPVKQATIPKKGGKVRYLGIPTLRDRVAQMALKLVLEPIFEVDFYPSSYGYRPGRRAQDAIAEIHHFTCKPSTYEWVNEGDIKACFDNVDHHVLMQLVGERISDRKVLRLVGAFLRAGVVEKRGGFAEALTGTPQGGVASPRLANIYLSVLDRHFSRIWDEQMTPAWRRQYRRRTGRPNFRLIRYADDFVVLVHGTRSEAEALKAEIPALLADKLRMTLSQEKTHITHIDDGFVFLGGLLPLRRVQEDVLLPRLVGLVEADSLDPPQAPPPDLETDPAALLRHRPDRRGRHRPLQPGEDAGRALPLPRSADQHALQHRRGGPRRSTLPPDPPRR
jgi:RNA-directed DNA polymerase